MIISHLINEFIVKGFKILSIDFIIDRILSKYSSLKIIHFLAGLKIRKQSIKCNKLIDYYNLVKKFKFVPLNKKLFTVRIRMAQKKKEFLNFLKVVAELNPEQILEIGTFDGGTLFLISKVSAPNAELISIDLPHYERSSGYAPYRINFYRFFNIGNQKLFFIRKNSHQKECIENVKSIFKNNSIDLLFIDGDHTYEGVKEDFLIYSPFVKSGGLIAFHDIVDHPKELNCEVSRFWNELKAKYETIEFINNPDERWGGIGVIKKP